MAKMMTVEEWRASLPSVDEFVEAVTSRMSGLPAVDGSVYIGMADLPDACKDVRAAFERIAINAGWIADFMRSGGGPEVLRLTPAELQEQK